MLALIEFGREPAGDGDELGGRLDQVVRESGRGIDLRVPIELPPPRVMMRNHMDHQISGAHRFKPFIPERIGKVLAQCRVLVHHDCEPRDARWRGLDDHRLISLGQNAIHPAGLAGPSPAELSSAEVAARLSHTAATADSVNANNSSDRRSTFGTEWPRRTVTAQSADDAPKFRLIVCAHTNSLGQQMPVLLGSAASSPAEVCACAWGWSA
jgi:hypothetical protein